MIFYIALDENGHRQLRGTQAEAKAVNKNFESLDIPTDKAGLMAYVQTLFDGVPSAVEAPAPSLPTSAPEPNYTQQSIDLDDQFEKLPLAHQLHFAAMAMENARDNLGSMSTRQEVDEMTG